MLIPPKYQLTPKISQFLASTEASRAVIDSFPLAPEIEQNIRRASTLKSSLYSAKIEGNTLSLEELQMNPSKDQKKVEVFNILKALNWVRERSHKDLISRDILELHNMVMAGLVERLDQGKFRTNLEAIFNSAGMVVYIPPRPSQVFPLIQKLINFINSSKETSIPIKACLVHYSFEKIHPFLDGSGRTGRLILQLILARGGYGMKGLLSLEEFLDQHRSEYYKSLEEPERDVTDYLEFMLEAISSTAEAAKNLVLEKKEAAIEDFLLPRRAEILNIIKDHGLVNFDILRRRFMAVNERTLRYDLLQLQKQGLIKKRGTTKGAFYQLASQGPAFRG